MINLQTQVTQAISALDLITSSTSNCLSFGDGYKQIGINFSVEVCAIAAEITGYDDTFCKMLNYKFRSAAASLMFERAQTEIAA